MRAGVGSLKHRSIIRSIAHITSTRVHGVTIGANTVAHNTSGAVSRLVLLHVVGVAAGLLVGVVRVVGAVVGGVRVVAQVVVVLRVAGMVCL